MDGDGREGDGEGEGSSYRRGVRAGGGGRCVRKVTMWPRGRDNGARGGAETAS